MLVVGPYRLGMMSDASMLRAQLAAQATRFIGEAGPASEAFLLQEKASRQTYALDAVPDETDRGWGWGWATLYAYS